VVVGGLLKDAVQRGCCSPAAGWSTILRVSRPLLLLLGLAGLPALAAEELPPEKVAEIQHAQDQARRKVEKQFGDRLPSELSNEERGALIRATQAAALEVFDKHGVTAKDFALQETRLDREELAAVKAAKEALIQREQAAREQAEKEAELRAAAEAEREVEVIVAPSDENPVELFREEGVVDVERPTEQELLELRGEQAPPGDEEEAAPEPKPAPKRGKRQR